MLWMVKRANAFFTYKDNNNNNANSDDDNNGRK